MVLFHQGIIYFPCMKGKEMHTEIFLTTGSPSIYLQLPGQSQEPKTKCRSSTWMSGTLQAAIPLLLQRVRISRKLEPALELRPLNERDNLIQFHAWPNHASDQQVFITVTEEVL